MKKIFLLLLMIPLENHAARTFSPMLWKKLQCDTLDGKKEYRSFFTRPDNVQINNGETLSVDSPYSAFVEKCIRQSKLSTIRNFISHFLLAHIHDAYLALDGLGQAASLSDSTFNKRINARVNFLITAGDTPEQAHNKALDSSVNWRRPNFDIMLKRLIFFRHAWISKEKKIVMLYHKTPDILKKELENFYSTKELTDQKIEELKEKYLVNLGSRDKPNYLDFEQYLKVLTYYQIPAPLEGEIGWDEVEDELPDVAKELNKVLQRLNRVNVQLMKKVENDRTGRLFAETFLPSEIPDWVFGDSIIPIETNERQTLPTSVAKP